MLDGKHPLAMKYVSRNHYLHNWFDGHYDSHHHSVSGVSLVVFFDLVTRRRFAVVYTELNTALREASIFESANNQVQKQPHSEFSNYSANSTQAEIAAAMLSKIVAKQSDICLMNRFSHCTTEGSLKIVRLLS